TPVDPVKWTPAKSGLAINVSEIIAASPITIFMTPAGTPASLKTSIITFAEYIWVLLGFQTTTLPISAALAGRFPAMAVKLKGVIAYTNPSKGLYSMRFQAAAVDSGCSA